MDRKVSPIVRAVYAVARRDYEHAAEIAMHCLSDEEVAELARIGQETMAMAEAVTDVRKDIRSYGCVAICRMEITEEVAEAPDIYLGDHTGIPMASVILGLARHVDCFNGAGDLIHFPPNDIY